MDDFKLCNIKWGICDISQEQMNDTTYVEGDDNDDNDVKKNLARIIGDVCYVEGLKRICEKEKGEFYQMEARINLDRTDIIYRRLTENKRSLFDEIEDGLSRIRDIKDRDNGRSSFDYWNNRRWKLGHNFLYQSYINDYYYRSEESYYLLIELVRDNEFFEYASDALVELLEKSIKVYKNKNKKKYWKLHVDFLKLFRYEFCGIEYELRRMYDLIKSSWRIIFTDSPEYDYSDKESLQGNLDKVNKLLSDFNEKTAKQEYLLCCNMVNAYSKPVQIDHILYSRILEFDLLWRNINKGLGKNESKKKDNDQCYALMHVEHNPKYYFSVCGSMATEKVFVNRIGKYLPKTYEPVEMSSDTRYYYRSTNEYMYITYEKADNVSGLLECKEKRMIIPMFSCCERKLLSKIKYDTTINKVRMYTKLPPCYKCKVAIEALGGIEINNSNKERKDKSRKYRVDNDILAHKIRRLTM